MPDQDKNVRHFIDITSSASAAYRFVWEERAYLFRLALAPFLLKFISYVGILYLGWQDQLLRQALVFVPSYLVTGWMVSHVVRLIYLDQRWPFRPTGNQNEDLQRLQDKAQGIMAGTLAFALVQFLLDGYVFSLTLVAGEMNEMAQTGEISTENALIAAFLIFLGYWFFRYLWFFIPAALDTPLKAYSKLVASPNLSLPMIGLWLMCFLPPFFLIYMTLALFIAPFAGEADSMTGGLGYTAAFFFVVIDMAVTLLSVAAFCFALRRLASSK